MTIGPSTTLESPRPLASPRRETAKQTGARQEAVVLREFGGAAGFELARQPMPSAGPGEVRVRVLAACVQFTDVILRKGKYPDLKQKPPLVLGYDVVGVIDELGPGVSSLRVGDRVADLTMTGSYARYRTLRADRVVPVPDDVDAAEAATLVLSWVTAYQLLHREAHVTKGQKILIQGATGAVGQALLTLAGLAGLSSWGTASAKHADLLRSFGATPLDYTKHEDIRRAVPEGFDVVFDGIGQRGFAASWAAVKPGGRLCAFGLSSALDDGPPLAVVGWWLLRLHFWNRLSRKAAGFYSITALRKKHPDWYRADLQALFRLLSSKAIHPRVAERIELSGVADAHRRLEAGGLDGKIVICPT
jgi:NADPH:quinone reductase